ncbi:hypothetical protein [Streptomyces niveus]|uniref:hypothetical protein n=1 Tax=Streptomyces niveus TaxID=193462 RepID=UPI00084BFEA4|nr:hypothetical protein [Streptomyces niveus]
MNTPPTQADEALRQIQASPSYAQQVLLTTAAVLRIQAERVLHPRVLDIALGFGADAIVGELPTAVQLDAMDRARAALPDVGNTVTHGEYALLLDAIAKTV